MVSRDPRLALLMAFEARARTSTPAILNQSQLDSKCVSVSRGRIALRPATRLPGASTSLPPLRNGLAPRDLRDARALLAS
jgi:hypothetical protein